MKSEKRKQKKSKEENSSLTRLQEAIRTQEKARTDGLNTLARKMDADKVKKDTLNCQ